MWGGVNRHVSGFIYPQVHESLDADKSADVTEGGGEGSAEGAVLEREHLPDE